MSAALDRVTKVHAQLASGERFSTAIFDAYAEVADRMRANGTTVPDLGPPFAEDLGAVLEAAGKYEDLCD